MAELMLYIARLPSEDVFISGGGSMYRQMLPFCDTFYVTHILKTFEGADCYFPDLTAEEGIEKVSQSDIREENGVRYYFARYERKK
jgi:dihydrofolate reductase